MLFCEEDKKMKFKIGGREHGQSIHNVLKLYNYIQSLSDDTVVKIVKAENTGCYVGIDRNNKQKILGGVLSERK